MLKNEKEICQAYFIQICNDEIRVRLYAFTGLLTRIESAYCRQLPGAGPGLQEALSFALLRQFYRFCGLTVARVRRQGGSAVVRAQPGAHRRHSFESSRPACKSFRPRPWFRKNRDSLTPGLTLADIN
jgi:hypothetical protein